MTRLLLSICLLALVTSTGSKPLAIHSPERTVVSDGSPVPWPPGKGTQVADGSPVPWPRGNGAILADGSPVPWPVPTKFVNV